MSRICGSSKPIPTPLNGEDTKSTRDANRKRKAWCYMDYPGLGNRSVFYPYSSRNIITFDVVEATGSSLTSNVSFVETLARASLKTYLPGCPGVETKRVGQGTAVYGTDAPKTPSFRRGGEICKDNPRMGNWSGFHPYSSVGNTITLAARDRSKPSTKPSPYHPQGEWGEKASTEKRKVSTKSEAIVCPSMRSQFLSRSPPAPKRAGSAGHRRKITRNTPYLVQGNAINHLNPDRNSGKVSCATNESPKYPDQPRH